MSRGLGVRAIAYFAHILYCLTFVHGHNIAHNEGSRRKGLTGGPNLNLWIMFIGISVVDTNFWPTG